MSEPTAATALVPVTMNGALAPSDLIEAARDYVAASKSEATRKAYRSDWQSFEAWCGAQNVTALPATPETVALYLTALAQAGRKVAGVERALAAISQAHRAAGYESPRKSAAVQAVRQGIRRTHGTAQLQKAPVLVPELRAMVKALPDNLVGIRDRALLLLGFVGAFRRSELVDLDVQDLAFVADGLEVTIRRSKVDQEGAGAKLGIPHGSDPATCAPRALKAWLAAAGITTGAVFRSVLKGNRLATRRQNGDGRLTGRDVARIVQRTARAAGLDATKLAGHSLRAGLATSAARAGKSERAIMAQGRWSSPMMARRYIRDASIFEDNAASGIGL